MAQRGRTDGALNNNARALGDGGRAQQLSNLAYGHGTA